MGVSNAHTDRAAVFSLDRFVDLRGLVNREGISQQLALSRRSSIVELRGGAGWGKTSAAVAYAAERHRAGAQVILIEGDGRVRICPAPDGDVLYVIDDCEVSDEVADELISRVQEDGRVQIIVCSRERHPLIQRAHVNGLVTRRVDLGDFRLTAVELLEIARTRGVQLDPRRGEYVVHAAGGWPIVAIGFIDLFADGARDASMASIDHLVTRSFEVVLSDLLGEGALPLLVKATLSGGIRREATGARGKTSPLESLVERVRRLGLGEWVSA